MRAWFGLDVAMRLRNIIPLTSAESMSAIEDWGILERTRSKWRLSALVRLSS
ncbi:MAG: hypothetical protein AAFQ81_07710 [Pseudomonadota bacterium]